MHALRPGAGPPRYAPGQVAQGLAGDGGGGCPAANEEVRGLPVGTECE